MPTESNRSHLEAIFAVVRTIPPGRVMSYGQVGFEAGVSPRRVGWAMAVAGDAADVPWHRVVGAHGDLKIAARSAVLGQMQRDMLVGEGVAFLENGLVDMDLYRVGAPDGI